MHLKTKKIAFLGLLLALAMVAVVLGSVLEMNTLFFLAAASFCTGVAILEVGLVLGSGFFVAGLFLSFLLSPNKLYCLTYGGMSLYLLITAFVKRGMEGWKNEKGKKIATIIIKFILFNSMYIPIIIFLPELIFPGHTLRGIMLLGVLVAGQIVWLLYDYAFNYFAKRHWKEINKKLNL